MKFQIADLTPQFEEQLKAMDISTDPEARANFLLASQQPLMALDEVENVDGSVAKARALLELDRLPEAGVAARKAVNLHPKNAQAWLALARLEFANGNNNETLAAADRSLKLQKTPEAVELRKIAQLNLGKK